MKGLKQIVIQSIPDIIWDYYRVYQYSRKKSVSLKRKEVRETFDEIYKSNYWNSAESYSGTGSDLTQTEVVREVLPELAKKYGIQSMLDIPCGDYNWMQHVALGNVNYIGGDIVPGLIERNIKSFSRENINFEVINVLDSSLPKVDLIFCRDCLVHFSYEHIGRAIDNIISSGSKYLLTTSFIKRRLNFDIQTGDWRPINLEINPFNLPKPLETILEKCTEGNGKSYDKSLLLYLISDL